MEVEDSRPLTLSVAEAARLLGIGRNSAYEAVRRGEIPSIRIGRRVLIPRTALMVLLECGWDTQRGTDRDRAVRGS